MKETSVYRLEPPNPITPALVNRQMFGVSDRETVSFSDYWLPIRNHLRLIIALFLVVQIGTFVFLLTRTPIYTSESTILIDRDTPQVLVPNPQLEETEHDLDTFYKTQYELLESRSLIAQVIRDENLERNKVFTGGIQRPSLLRSGFEWIRSALPWQTRNSSERDSRLVQGVEPTSIDRYVSGLSVRPTFNTRLVSVAFSSPDPVLAYRIANAHVREFILQNYRRQAQIGEEAQHYLEGKLKEIEARVEKSEAALNVYRRERGIVEFSLDDKHQMVSDRLANLNRKLVDAEAVRIGLEADVSAISARDYDSLPAVIDSKLIQELKEESTKLEGRYASVSNQFTPNYPAVAQLHAQLVKEQALEREEIGKVVASIRSKYKTAVSREDELRREFEREKTQAMALKDASLQESVLARDVETNRALYQSLLERIKTLGVSQDSHINNVSIVDMAEIPRVPSSPKKKLALVLTGFVALLIGVAASLILEANDKGFKTAEEIRSYLYVPSLATVPKFAVPVERWAKHAELVGSQTEGDSAGQSRPVPRELFSTAAESYRAVRTSILLSRSETPPKTILFSSAVGGEGKSTIATSTAIMFAQMEEPVLLIDADLRHPSCHKMLGRSCEPGLSEVLSGLRKLDDVIQRTKIKGLNFLGAGLTPPNPTELLSSRKMQEILEALAASHPHVLVDSPPILPVSDSLVLSTLLDGVVLVTSADTARNLVGDACDRLKYVGSTILGVVLNNADPSQSREYANYGNYR